MVTNVSCFGGNNGSVIQTVTDGTSPYTYLWNSGATTKDLTNVIAGIYNVTITDAKGCTLLKTYTITQPSALTLSGVTTNVSCNGGNNGSVTITPGGGTTPYSYSWSNGTITKDLSNLTAGTYSVTVTDARLCTIYGSWTVTQTPIITLTAVATNVGCNGGSTGAINITPGGGTTPYTFNWSNNLHTEDLTGLTAAIYTVTVIDNKGCTISGSWTLTQPAAALAATAVITNVSCNGGTNGSIVQTVTGGTSPYTYSWSPVATTKDRTGIGAGTYLVTITDATLIKTWTVTQPVALSVTSALTHINCSGNSTGAINLTPAGGTSPYTWLWNDGVTTEDRTNLPANIYVVTLTDNHNCQLISSYTINALNQTPQITNTNLLQTICSGTPTTALVLTADVAGTIFSWNGTASLPGITGYQASGTGNIPSQVINNFGAAPGTVTYQITPASNGCQGSSVNSIITIMNLASIQLTGPSTGCQGTPVPVTAVFTGTPPWTFNLYNGVSAVTYSGISANPFTFYVTPPATTTTYTILSLKDGHSCFSPLLGQHHTITLLPLPTGSMTGTTSICAGSYATLTITLTGTPPWNLTWSDGVNHTINSIAASPYILNVAPSTTKVYSLVSVADANCQATNLGSPATVTVMPAPTATISGTFNLCSGQSVTIPVTLSGNPPFSFTYTDGNNYTTLSGITSTSASFTVNPQVAATYYLTAVNDAHCQGIATGSVVVNVSSSPTAALSGPSQLCSGNTGLISVALTGNAPWSLTWSDGTSHVVTGITSSPYLFSVAPTTTKTYTISALSDASCIGSNFGTPLTITVLPLPTAKITGTNSICFGNLATLTITLTGSEPWTVSWFDGESHIIENITSSPYIFYVNPVITTTYTLQTVTDAHCNGIITGSPVVVTVNPIPDITFTGVGAQNSVCSGNNLQASVHFTAGLAPYTLTYYDQAMNLFTLSNLIEDQQITIIPPYSPGSYTFTLGTLTDARGCTHAYNYPFVITVHPVPVASAGPNFTLLTGDSVVLQGSALGGTLPYAYLWTPATFLNNPALSHPLCTPLLTTNYTLQVTDANGCTATDQTLVTVTQTTSTVYGSIRYNNQSHTPLPEVTVKVKNVGGVTVATTTTNSLGYFIFPNLPAGSYYLDYQTDLPWGGVNSTDAQLIMSHFVGIITLTGINKKAADLDGNNLINSIDALYAAKRFIGFIYAFPVGDWAFQNKSFTVPTATPDLSIPALCYADVNGSYNPLAKKEPNVNLLYSGNLIVSKDQKVSIPVSIDRRSQLGSYSVILNYDNNLMQVSNITSIEDNGTLLFNINNGEIRIGWYSVNPTEIDINEPLFTITASVSGSVTESSITASYDCELADANAVPIENLHLMMPRIILASEAGFSLDNNLPNPFSGVTHITFNLPESGNVTITVYNNLGEVVQVPVNNLLSSGRHDVIFDGTNLPVGMYWYTVNYYGPVGLQSLTSKMLITR
ncbi:MAG: carboxypeptidase regulatory-like domain-containing protein [Bacteroidetes bacterium]|nr:carboxypeptidase regulatory-like domain-containing protein [Bacteroidota bacterium]